MINPPNLIGRRHTMHEFEIGNGVQTIGLSEVGGTITRWQYHGVDIFYPQKLVKRERKMKLRGGMHVCWPCFGTVDSKYGLPQHGVLRNRVDDGFLAGNGLIFNGTDLLGPTYSEESEVEIEITLTETGFIYTLSARLAKPASREVFINPGLHPYFATPTGNARAGAWNGREHRFYLRKQGPKSSDIGQGADVVIPGIGKIQMMLGGAWDTAPGKKIYFWRDSRKYLCVEPVFGSPKTYGEPGCLRLTDEWFTMTCTFQVLLD